MERGARPGPLFSEGSPRSQPRSLITAISEIQELAIVEKMGRSLPEQIMLLDRSFAYAEVGVYGVALDALFSVIGIPLSIAVCWNLMPIFGSWTPGLFDKCIALFIGVGYGVVFNVMIGRTLGGCYYGKVCKRSIDLIYETMIYCNVFKILILFLAFHGIRNVLTPEFAHNIFDTLWPALRPFMSTDSAVVFQDWMVNMREVMIVSSWWALATTLLSLLVPYVYFQRGEKRAAEEHRLNVLYDGY